MIIERFEGDIAIIEYKNKFYEIHKDLINASEGDIIDIIVLKEKTKEQEDKIKNLVDDLFY